MYIKATARWLSTPATIESRHLPYTDCRRRSEYTLADACQLGMGTSNLRRPILMKKT